MKGECAPRRVVGDAGRRSSGGTAAAGRAGAPVGPDVESKNWVEVWFGRRGVPWHERRFDGVGAALGRRRKEPALGAEEVQVELAERRLREVCRTTIVSWPVWGSGWIEPAQLDVGAEAVGGEEHAVAVRRAAARRGRSPPEIGPGAPRCRSSAVPTFENSGQVPVLACVPIAPVGVGAGDLAVGRVRVDREPSGRVTVAAGSRTATASSGSCGCGTLRSMSSPEAVSGWVGGRLRGEARVEAELIAAGRLGNGRPPMQGVAAVVFDARFQLPAAPRRWSGSA